MASGFWSFHEFNTLMREQDKTFDQYCGKQKRAIYESAVQLSNDLDGATTENLESLANELQLVQETAHSVKQFRLSEEKFQPSNFPLHPNGGDNCYFLPPSAVRRSPDASATTNFYCVVLSSFKKRKCLVSINQLNTETGKYTEIGQISFKKEDNLCAHNCASRQVEFCIDEIEGKLYQLSYTDFEIVIIGEHKLVRKQDGSFIFDRFPEIQYASQFEVPPLIVSCSQFCIRQAAGPVKFAFAISCCLEDGGAKDHVEVVMCGIQLDRASKTLKIGRKRGKLVFAFKDFMPITMIGEELCLSRTKIPEMWLISRDRLIGNFRSLLLPPGRANRLLFTRSFADSTKHTSKFTHHLLYSPELRLIGKMGKWLVLGADFDHLSFGRKLGKVNMYQSIKLNELFAASFDKDEHAVNMLVVEDEQLLCVQTLVQRGRKELSGRLHRFSLARVFFELNARQCAHCLKFDENRKFLTNSRKHQSSFKVCRVCKKQKLHTNWLENKCHFCSVECFKNGWNEHKKMHKSAV